MLALDLRWVTFVSLLTLVAVFLVAFRIGRRERHAADAEGIHDGVSEIRPVLEQAPFGLVVLERPGTYLYANPYARHYLGLALGKGPLPEERWVQMLEEDRLMARNQQIALGRYRSISLPEGKSATGQTDNRAKQSIRWWITPLGSLDVVFVLDVTGQQRAEEAGRSLVNDLSHELRTPLATILTHLEIMGLPQVSLETQQQSTRLLKLEVQRMVRLVNQMLDLGRLETSIEIEPRPVDLLALVEEVRTQIKPQAEEKGVTITLEADTPLPLILGDRDQLRQVFLNLLDNAVKYSRSGDTIRASLKSEEGTVRCAVCDTGPGVPAKHLPHLGRRFYRVAPQETEGSGLGLVLVEEILRRHGSDLAIKSQAEGQNTGTNVRFDLPLASAVSDAAEVSSNR